MRTMKNKGSFSEDQFEEKTGGSFREALNLSAKFYSNYINPSFQTNIGTYYEVGIYW